MENRNKKANIKSIPRVKLVLIAVLVAIMLPLILIYAIVGDTEPKMKIFKENTTVQAPVDGNEPEIDPVSESENEEGASQEAEEPVTQAPQPPKKALIYAPTDEENWAIAIISVNYPLPDNYQPALASALEGSNIQLDTRVALHYSEMYAAAKQDGCVLTPYSGYHSYSLQQSTFERKVNFYISQGLSAEEADSRAKLQVLPAGCSEHNAGLAIDIVSASADFVNTKEFQWLSDNAYKYGFVLRYPEDKVSVTGVSYEPWHWRFVGVTAAKEIKEKGQCLEEYLGIG